MHKEKGIPMTHWEKTSCGLCLQCCGLEVLVENNRIVKVRPDKDNPRSRAYVCRKGLKIAHLQHNSQRLNYPMGKKNGQLERLTWDRALTEICSRLGDILEKHRTGWSFCPRVSVWILKDRLLGLTSMN